MSKLSLALLFIMISAGSAVAADGQPAGTKGQNYDRLAFESASDEVQVVAKVMALRRHADGSSTIVVTDNGASVLAPTSDGAERWNRTIAIKGKGKHELVMICSNTKSAPVYCTLDADDQKISLLR